MHLPCPGRLGTFAPVTVLAITALGVLVVVLGGAGWRWRTARDLARTETTEVRDVLAAARDELVAAVDSAATARRERDDALERAQRARREATEVARRLQEQTDEVRSLTDQRDELTTRVDELTAELRAATERPPTGSGPEALWALAMESCRRLWETSVAVVPGQTCPLDEPDAGLRTCIEIEVDASREDTGAPIDLAWDAVGEPAPGTATLALAVVREIVAHLGKHAAEAIVRVAGGDELTITVVGVDDEDRPLVLTGVAGAVQVGPGRWSVPAAAEAATV